MKGDSSPEWRGGNHRYRHLPEPVRLEDTIAEQDVRPVPDPEGGINPEQAFMLRFAGG